MPNNKKLVFQIDVIVWYVYTNYIDVIRKIK